MKNLSYLLLSLFFSSCVHTPNSKKISIELDSLDLMELFRIGYDITDDSVFTKACHLMNDSILRRHSILGLQVVSVIDYFDSTTTWGMVDIKYHVIAGVPDILLMLVDLDKNEQILVDSIPVQLNELKDIARKKVFYPDTPYYDFTHTKKTYDLIGEVETTRIFAFIKISYRDGGFSIDNWRFFYKVLHELIEACNDQKNVVSLELWDKPYDSLTIDQKDVIESIIGYRIKIYFDLSE